MHTTRCLTILTALACATLVSGLSHCQTIEKPPHQRLLRGDDAKRAAELTKQMEVEAGETAAVLHAAEELLALRQRIQGVDHHEAISQRWRLEAIRKVAALTPAQRAAYHTALNEGNQAAEKEQQGQYAQALSAKQRALEQCRLVLGERHPDTATCIQHVASNLYAQGRYTEAQLLARQGLDIRRALLGEDHPDTALSYTNVAANLASQGKHTEAQPFFAQAHAIYQRVLGERCIETASSSNNAAFNANAQGKYAEAEPLYRQTLALFRELAGERTAHTATCCNNLALNLQDQGKLPEAEKFCKEALEIRREVLGQHHIETARSYNNLAAILESQDKYAEAEPFYRQALEINRSVLGQRHPRTAQCCSNLAVNQNAQSKFADADVLFHEAVGIARQVLGEHHVETGRFTMNMAANLRSQGRLSEALEALEAAAKTYELARLRVSTQGLGRAAYSAEWSPHAWLTALLAASGKPADAWRALEADLARGSLEEASVRRGRMLAPADRERQEKLTQELDQLPAPIVQIVVKAEPTPAEKAKLEELLQTRQRLEKELVEIAASLSRQEVATLAEVQANLPVDGALIAWVDKSDRSRSVQEHWGCVVRREGPPVWERLPGQGPGKKWTLEDRELPDKLRVTLSQGPAQASNWQLLARSLHAQRLAPLMPRLKGVRRLFVVSVELMAGLPIEALLQPEEQFTVSYVPSCTAVARQAETRKKLIADRPRLRESTSLLALGDPVFKLTEKAGAQPVLAPLPGSAREVRAIAGLFDRTTLLLGSDASEQKLEELRGAGQLPSFRYLHFATHGLADRQRQFASALFLAQDRLANPLQQEIAGKKPCDGRLTAAEVLDHWKLDAELVVLSACESGQGREGGGEGLLGFSQAFLLAGARSVVLSQWQVSDTATALLMVRFYQNMLGRSVGLEKPMTKAAALKEAKDWLRNLTRKEAEERLANLPEAARGLKLEAPERVQPTPDDRPFAHPYYWSAFILIGDPE